MIDPNCISHKSIALTLEEPGRRWLNIELDRLPLMRRRDFFTHFFFACKPLKNLKFLGSLGPATGVISTCSALTTLVPTSADSSLGGFALAPGATDHD